MLNFTGLARTPGRQWRVLMDRCKSLNAHQNTRAKAIYVSAPDAATAMQEARRLYPEFFPRSAKPI